MKILFTKKSEKELSRLSSIDIPKVIQKIEELSFPFSPHLNIKKLQGSPGFYRLRVDRVRVIFEIDAKEIWIRKIGYRGDVYR